MSRNGAWACAVTDMFMDEQFSHMSLNESQMQPSHPMVRQQRPSTGQIRNNTSPVRLPKALQRPATCGSIRASQRLFKAQTEGSLMVEGCQTGQFVCIETPKKSLPPSQPAADQAAAKEDQRRQMELERERKERLKDKALIKKMEIEIKKLKQIISGKDEQIISLNITIEKLEAALKSSKEIFQSEIDSLKSSLQVKNSEIETLKTRTTKSSDEFASLNRTVEQLKSELSSKERQLTGLCDQLASSKAENTLLQDKLKDLQMREGESNRSRSEVERIANSINGELKREVESLKRKIELMQADVDSEKRKYSRGEDEMKDLNDLVTKCYSFIQKLCQPQFSVVKDESLTPVNPTGFHVIEGHVLIPLQLLLEGYNYLPSSFKNTTNTTAYNPPTMQSVQSKRSRSVGA